MQQNFEEDLVVFFTKPPFEPQVYKQGDKLFTVISMGEYHLNDFSETNTLHEFIHQAQKVVCTFVFSIVGSRYGGPIVIYTDENQRYWITPDFEFNASFTKVEA